MPMKTIGDAVAEARYELSDLTPALALKAADTVHRKLCGLLPELCRQKVTLALGAGQTEYVLDSGVVEIEGATFTAADGSTTTVMDETVETLRAQNRGFRAAAPANWAESGVAMFVTSDQVAGAPVIAIGFYPPPDATSATGSLTLYLSMAPPDPVTLQTPILPGLHSSQVYVEGILFYASRSIRPEAADNYMALFESETQSSGGIVRTRQEGVKIPQEQNVRSAGNRAQ